MDTIGRYSFQEYLKMVEAFHGSQAPGLVLGGIMVDYALSEIPAGVLFDAICETSACLPDAIQLLTPCTTGNGWLKVIDLGLFALSLYDKYQGEGVRIFVDPEKIKEWVEISNWLYKLKPKKEQDKDRLLAQMEQAGRAILSKRLIGVKPQHLARVGKGAISNCPECGEPYPKRDGALCLACQGRSPYIVK
ncbi:MAG: formylmethanofuran dehydrogenase subunit E family protein [Syntrophobacteraceae bacterium]|nr:formylmethanofuran dehydrogenase subunit E family protein [Syntrophobacteraceae bacterium]